jgi:uncharacterized protein
MTLENFFNENKSVALGFSGGADSSFLLYTALHYGANVTAYYIKTAFQPAFELRDAQETAKLLGAKLVILEADIFNFPDVVHNPPDRCYHCKKAIFNTLKTQITSEKITIIDGTNFSDDDSDRPGMRALSELAVRSPLRECGIIKEEVRRLSKEADLPTWDKPAYACLATRIPTSRAITQDLLGRVERAEDALFALGFTNFRVRVYGEAARLQFPEKKLYAALSKRAEIIKAVKPHFDAVLLDLEGR